MSATADGFADIGIFISYTHLAPTFSIWLLMTISELQDIGG
jgi:hypothetical protein